MPNKVENKDFAGSTTWEVVENAFRPKENCRRETLFSLGNGYLGTRGTFEEGLNADTIPTVEGTYVNGFFESSPIIYGETAYGFASHTQTMLNLPNGKTVRIYLADEDEFSLLTGKIIDYRRVLDLRRGLLTRTVTWESPHGRRVRVIWERLVSMQRKHIMALQCSITPLNFDGRIKLVSVMDAAVSNLTTDKDDPRVGSGFGDRGFSREETMLEGATGAFKLRTGHSNLSLACAMTHDLEIMGGRQADQQASCQVSCQADHQASCQANHLLPVQALKADDRLEVHYEVELTRERTVTLRKYLSYVTAAVAVAAVEPLLPLAVKLAEQASLDGFPALCCEQENYLQNFWQQAHIAIDGDPDVLKGLRLNMFHLLQSAGRDGRTSISAKGLSGQGYGGHYFWEAEIYMLPFFLHNCPSIARGLLECRYHMLDKARERARQMAHPKGALFPWRSIDGEECSAFFEAGTAQYHINADIALAVRKYVEATADYEFLRSFGAEIVFETARLWADLGSFNPKKDGRFCLNEVTGPDEYTALVNNNFYTNLMARENLWYAAETAAWLQHNHAQHYHALATRIDLDDEEIRFWRKAADKMYLPYDQELRVHPQDDTFLDKAVWDFANTPADHYPLLLHYHPLVIYRHQVCKQADVVLALFLLGDQFSLEEKRNDFNYYEPLTTHDSSLSPAIFSIMASELSYYEKAYRYFHSSACMDLDDLYGNTDSGIHAANMAGSWLALVCGFGGMRVYEGNLHFRPYLPARWRHYSFRVTFRNRLLEVCIKAAHVTYRLLSGKPLTFKHYDAPIELSKEKPVASVDQIKAFIFDLDGVLTDTAEYHFRAWQQLAAEEGIPFDRHDNERLRGISRRESLLMILNGRPRSEEQIDALMERKNSYYAASLQTMNRDAVLPGSIEVLTTLREQGYKMAIASSSKNTQTVLERLGLAGYFDAVADGYSVERAKPAPDIFLRAAQLLDVPPRQCAVIEDAAAGVEGALAAGMIAIGLGPAERVGQAHFVFPSLAEVELGMILGHD